MRDLKLEVFQVFLNIIILDNMLEPRLMRTPKDKYPRLKLEAMKTIMRIVVVQLFLSNLIKILKQILLRFSKLR